jgi:hypothetical protein
MTETMKRKYEQDTGKPWIEYADSKTLFADSENEPKQVFAEGKTLRAGDGQGTGIDFGYLNELAEERARNQLEAERIANNKGLRLIDFLEENKNIPGEQIVGDPSAIDFNNILEGLSVEDKQAFGIILTKQFEDIPKNYQVVFAEFLKSKHAEMGLLTSDEVYGIPRQSIQEINSKTIFGETFFTKNDGGE